MFFPDWEDWPQTLASAKFEVSYNGATVAVPATTLAGPNRVDASVGVADSAVWKALFEASTPVKGFKYTDLSPSVLLSYDAVAMAERIEDLYRDLARAAIDRMPRVTELIETERWRGFIGAVEDLDKSSVDTDTGLRDPHKQFDTLRRAWPQRIDELTRFQLFHTPPAASVIKQKARKDDARIDARWREHSKTELPKREDLSETIDFHQIVAAMGSYPTLLRRLGLVVDLVLAPGGFTAGSRSGPFCQGHCSLQVRFRLRAPRTAVPRLARRLSATHFDAVPDPTADNVIADGLLTLDPARYRLLQVDVDGAGLKVMNFARSLGRRFDAETRVDPVTRHEDEVGAPVAPNRRADARAAETCRHAVEAVSTSNNTRNTQLESQLAGGRSDGEAARAGSHPRLSHRHLGLGVAALAIAVPAHRALRAGRCRGCRRCRARGREHRAARRHAFQRRHLQPRYPLPARGAGVVERLEPGRASAGTGDRAPTTASTSHATRAKRRRRPASSSSRRLRPSRDRCRGCDLDVRTGSARGPSTLRAIRSFRRPTTSATSNPQAHARPYLRYEPVAAPVVALRSVSGAIERPLEGESMNRIAILSFNDTPADNLVPTTGSRIASSRHRR